MPPRSRPGTPAAEGRADAAPPVPFRRACTVLHWLRPCETGVGIGVPETKARGRLKSGLFIARHQRSGSDFNGGPGGRAFGPTGTFVPARQARFGPPPLHWREGVAVVDRNEGA